jgi:hypothetical protein
VRVIRYPVKKSILLILILISFILGCLSTDKEQTTRTDVPEPDKELCSTTSDCTAGGSCCGLDQCVSKQWQDWEKRYNCKAKGVLCLGIARPGVDCKCIEKKCTKVFNKATPSTTPLSFGDTTEHNIVNPKIEIINSTSYINNSTVYFQFFIKRNIPSMSDPIDLSDLSIRVHDSNGIHDLLHLQKSCRDLPNGYFGIEDNSEKNQTKILLERDNVIKLCFYEQYSPGNYTITLSPRVGQPVSSEIVVN